MEQKSEIIEFEAILSQPGAFERMSPADLPKILKFYWERLVALPIELNILKKRLQRLEIENKRLRKVSVSVGKGGGASAGARGKSGGQGKRVSSQGKAGGRTLSSNSRTSAPVRSKEKSVQFASDSGKTGRRSGSTTRIKIWKVIKPDEKKALRKEESLAYKKVPQKEWAAMNPLQRTVAAKERKLRIQQFQERITAKARNLAQERLSQKDLAQSEERKSNSRRDGDFEVESSEPSDQKAGEGMNSPAPGISQKRQNPGVIRSDTFLKTKPDDKRLPPLGFSGQQSPKQGK